MPLFESGLFRADGFVDGNSALENPEAGALVELVAGEALVRLSISGKKPQVVSFPGYIDQFLAAGEIDGLFAAELPRDQLIAASDR